MTQDIASSGPQCQFFVVRKKRLCRMTVRPGWNYCGEHQPQLDSNDGKDTKRIPCPNDSKHTCYASKLQKHLAICNARQQEMPPYIKYNVNAPVETNPLKQPLSEIPHTQLEQIINKINELFDTYLKDKIDTIPDREIHPAVIDDFLTKGRTESSLRHLRQVSKLMYMMEDESLVRDNTCYVELGAGKGHLSYFAWHAWCPESSGSCILLVERASLRHKRDNKIRDLLHKSNEGEHTGQQLTSPDWSNKKEIGSDNNNSNEGSFRLRADLAHLILDLVPTVQCKKSIVGFAKHLCGVATDYSLRCLSSPNTLPKTNGLLIATCCHHRCSLDGYVAHRHLMELGIDKKEFNVMLGIVSWATCGDGRSRDKRGEQQLPVRLEVDDVQADTGTKGLRLSREQREEVGRRAKAILDWGRVLYLRKCGFDARLAYFIPNTVSLENLCIIAKKN